ncbi:MAG TPA: hypothetical protein VNW92_05865 [Polyangiaceae bacterium]|jgi:hypothetical protein|nr:hypothetical protein [Polyangiaceae bacterium]
MRKLVAILMACTPLAACSGSSSSDSNPIPIEQVPSELAKSICAAVRACDPFTYNFAFLNTDCISTFSARLQQASYTDIQNAVTAGTVKYDGNQARTCATTISAGACSVLDNQLPDVCQQAFTGSAETGADCSIDQECKGLSRCDVSGGTCPGKCAPRSSAGVSCGKDDDCVKGLVCSTITSRCVAPPAEGEACGGTVAGDCAAGLLCVGAQNDKKKAGACMTEAAALTQKADDTCDIQNGPWCMLGLSCVAQSVSAGVVTSKCSAPSTAGGPCGIGIPGQCPLGQYCPEQVADLATGTAMSTCTPLPTTGQTCGPPVAFDRCAANLVCDDSTAPLKPVCVALRNLGETCSADALCVSQHCVGGACVPASPCAK